ncbi:protein SUPPRESSOR OF FRI 4 isoform X3 [Cryptomeria japonica]|uniref:protein SUPPRESSOR OF FRI 4 isoform X3 n=1 Tax=Cryptomeria japonica TaxID=3369 RepID=UPI0027DA5BE7|nr:protein SUPPRESSOR OF FRI 4 isoform X3 [Cryptomeria japonica]
MGDVYQSSRRVPGVWRRVSRVPNAKPDRESTEIDIFGMQGIPPEILAAHDGDQDEEPPAKEAKVEVPVPGFLGGLLMGSNGIGIPRQSVYPARPPGYAPPTSVPIHAPVWPTQPQPSQPWLSAAPSIPGQASSVSLIAPQPPQQPPQPLFPIQNIQPPPMSSTPPFRLLFPLRPPAPQQSTLVVSPSQPFSPRNSNNLPSSMPTPSNFAVLQPSSSLTPGPTSELRSLSQTAPLQLNSTSNQLNAPSSQDFSLDAGAPSLPITSSHMYASGPDTGGPSIGPPPVISNKAPTQGVSNVVYLVWDDEAMCMEERRLSLSQYQVHDETVQMNSIDAAIDRRISESRLAGRIGFGL